MDEAVQALLAEENRQETATGDRADQEARHAVLNEILAKAHTQEPEPADSPTRKAYRDDLVGQAVVEKFRRQGFNR